MADRRRFASKLVTGLAVIGVGVLFTLDNLGILRARDFVDYWPVLVIIVGLSDLVGGRLLAALFWSGIGTVLLLGSLDVIDFRFYDLFALWPLLFVILGVNLMRQALSQREKDLALDGDHTIRSYAVMAANRRTSRSHAFLGGDAVAVMGGCEIDLRSAGIANGEAVIDVTAFWGGVDILVPRDWSVRLEVLPLLGGAENHTESAKSSNQTLVVRGTAVMGGVEVKN
jgi:predicted membrane protein